MHGVSTKLIVLGLWLHSISCLAQERLAPGATWQFTNIGLVGSYFVRGTMTNDGDTVMGGETAQRLLINTQGYWPHAPYSTSFSGYYYFSTVGGLVKQWTTTGWDTLYRFDAGLGDHWYALGMDPGTSTIPCDPMDNRHTVIDTGHVTLNGVQLRQVTLLSYRQSAPLTPIFRTITERIHFPYSTLYNTCNEIICESAIPCTYSDPEIGDVPLGALEPESYCGIAWTDVPTDLGPPMMNSGDQLIVGPGLLTVNWNSTTARPTSVMLFDSAGKLCFEAYLDDASTALPHSLPSGVYVARIGYMDGVRSRFERVFIE